MGDLRDLETVMTQLFRLRGVLDPTSEAAGLGASISEAMALRFLADAGPCPQQDLASFLSLEKSTISRLVDALTAKGWVDRQPSPGNRRQRLISLTDTGTRAAAKVGQAIRRRHITMFATLTDREHQALAIALPALIRALSDEAAS